MIPMRIRLGLPDAAKNSAPIFEIVKESFAVNMKKILQQVKPPCPRCPYKLGLVHTTVNPCPQCKENGYQMFERFQKELTADLHKAGGGNRL